MDEEAYFNEVREYIKSEDDKDVEDIVKQIHEINKLYRKHAFDDDQTICKNYHDIIVNLKKLKAQLGKSK